MPEAYSNGRTAAKPARLLAGAAREVVDFGHDGEAPPARHRARSSLR